MQVSNNQSTNPYLAALSNQANTANASNNTNESSVQDSVNLSSPAKKLQKISAQFFSSGAISSKDIPSLVEELYKGGFISESELSNLGVDTSSTDSQSKLSEEALMLSQYLEKNRESLSEDKIKELEGLIEEL